MEGKDKEGSGRKEKSKKTDRDYVNVLVGVASRNICQCRVRLA